MSHKPKYINVKYSKNDKDLKTKIKAILDMEKFCVLASVSNNQCHTSLISFVVSDDLSKIVFATPVKTKKYDYISDNTSVALLIDNRSQSTSNLNDLIALNATGLGKILKDDQEIKEWSQLLILKHPNLEDFIKANTSALILVEVEKYNYVTSFQKINELKIR